MILLLQQISAWINTVVEKLLLVIGGSICLILFAQVLFRYIGSSLGWSEEVSRHLLVAITFLGGTAAYKRMSFIGLKGIGHGLGRSVQQVIVVALQVATLGCFCILAWFGTEYTIKAWQHTYRLLADSHVDPLCRHPRIVNGVYRACAVGHGNDF